MNENFINIGNRLANRMSELNLKQIDVCKMTGISKNAISNYINNIRIPDTTSIYKLSRALEVSIEWILVGQKNSTIQYSYNIVENYVADNSSNDNLEAFKLSELEKDMILRHREGNLILVDKDHQMLHEEVGELSLQEIDIILKFRKIQIREQYDVYDNLCWRYEREHQKPILPERSSKSKIG